MQSDPKLALGSAVSKIRRTQKEDLLIQLKPGYNPKSEFKSQALGTSLEGDAEVKTLTTIECKDVNEATADIAKEF